MLLSPESRISPRVGLKRSKPWGIWGYVPLGQRPYGGFERKKEEAECVCVKARNSLVAQNTCILGKGSPFPMSMFLNVIDEFLIFLWSPWTFLQSVLFTTSSRLGHDEQLISSKKLLNTYVSDGMVN